MSTQNYDTTGGNNKDYSTTGTIHASVVKPNKIHLLEEVFDIT